MSLIDVVIQVMGHPAVERFTPVVGQFFQSGNEDKALEAKREEIEMTRKLYAQMAADSLGGGAGVIAVQAVSSQESAAVPPLAPAPSKLDDLYAGGNRYDIGCAVCGKAHLAATAGMMQRAAKLAQDRGQCDDDCTYYVAAAQREVVNLIGYDWTPEAIAQTPDGERQVLEIWAPQVEGLQETLFIGPEMQARINLAKAAGALEEAGRFARAEGVNHPEAQLRIADAEALLAETERGEWSPERRQQMDPQARAIVDANLPAFRKQRQFLLNGMDTPEDLDRVAAEVGTLNAQMQGMAIAQLTPDQIRTMQDATLSVRQGFRDDLAPIIAAQGGHP